MNYEQYDKIGAFNWWINPRKPVDVWNERIPTPIKIIKIHGSLNWKYCNCCNQVLLTPWDTEVDIKSLEFKGWEGPSCENPVETFFDLECPNDNNRFGTFIIPPSHIKELSHPTISKLFDEAAEEIRKAKKIVFIGYSLPEADVHIKALFRKNISCNVKIEVVDPFLTDEIKSRYRGIDKNITFIKETFEQYIEGIADTESTI